MSQSFRVPLVGTFFRGLPDGRNCGPAVLANLPSGTPLTIVPEPTNPFDPNAIAVMLRIIDIPSQAHDNLELELAGYGIMLSELLQQQTFQLGYIAKAKAQELASWIPSAGTSASLGFSPEGKPQVVGEV